jgi:hypothetical protein
LMLNNCISVKMKVFNRYNKQLVIFYYHTKFLSEYKFDQTELKQLSIKDFCDIFTNPIILFLYNKTTKGKGYRSGV